MYQLTVKPSPNFTKAVQHLNKFILANAKPSRSEFIGMMFPYGISRNISAAAYDSVVKA